MTKRGLALVKAAGVGTLDDEDLVIASLLDLAEVNLDVQSEGVNRLWIRKTKYLVQKPTSASMSTTSSGQEVRASRIGSGRRRYFPRRKFRDALMAILEDEDVPEDENYEEESMLDPLGEDSMDEDEEDPTMFVSVVNPTSETSTTTSSSASAASVPSGTDSPLAEINAQEHKARNRVKEIKKMRQYFQGEAGGQGGNGKDREHVRRWVTVKEQQKTGHCFICRQPGHWSQECPYCNKAPIHATNVAFQTKTEPNWDLLQQCAVSSEESKESGMLGGAGQRSFPFHQLAVDSPPNVSPPEVCWSGDGHINKSRFAVILEESPTSLEEGTSSFLGVHIVGLVFSDRAWSFGGVGATPTE